MSGTQPAPPKVRPQCARSTGAPTHDDIPRIAMCDLCSDAVVISVAAIRRAAPTPCPWEAHPSTTQLRHQLTVREPSDQDR
ncbi:MAG TPA: hypothetical protein VGK51_17655 [Actinomycetota bacterium]|jgi:hypothetical protein